MKLKPAKVQTFPDLQTKGMIFLIILYNRVVCKTWAGLNGLGSGLGSILTLCLNRIRVISGDKSEEVRH